MMILMLAQTDPTAMGIALISAMTATLLLLWWTGRLHYSALDDAPPRHGTLKLEDIAITLGLFLLGSAALAILVNAWFEGVIESTSEADLLTLMLASHVLKAVPVVYVLIRAHQAVEGGLRGFGLTGCGIRHAVRRIGLGILALLVVVLGVGFLLTLITKAFGVTPPMIAHSTLQALVDAPLGPASVGLIVLAVLVTPLFEEIMFRGMLQTALLNAGVSRNRWVVILLVSLLFTALHIDAVFVNGGGDGGQIQFAWQALVSLLILSMGLGYLYEWSGSLWASILGHMAFNGMNVGLALLTLSDRAAT